MTGLFLILSFVVSLLVTLVVIRSADRHAHVSGDFDLSGPQKLHGHPVPRIGGVSIAVAMLISGALMLALDRLDLPMYWTLLACAAPAFGIGLYEDLSKRVSPNTRLAVTAVGAGMGIYLLDAVVQRSGIPGVDFLLQWWPISVLVTVVLVSGVTNAINIIDGLNGLASMCMMLMLAGLAFVAFSEGDSMVGTFALITLGAVLGFFVWNFPAGLIFLGDGGAYLIGFVFAELCLLLVYRNPTVSPLCPILICAYPLVETMFSIYRRRVLRSMSPSEADGMHLHTLIYKRLMRRDMDASPSSKARRNSMSSPYLWTLCVISVIPALVFRHSTLMCGIFLVVFLAVYVGFYRRIVRFKAPRWLVFRAGDAGLDADVSPRQAGRDA